MWIYAYVHRGQKSTEAEGTGTSDMSAACYGYEGLNLDSLQRQFMMLTAKRSLAYEFYFI